MPFAVRAVMDEATSSGGALTWRSSHRTHTQPARRSDDCREAWCRRDLLPQEQGRRDDRRQRPPPARRQVADDGGDRCHGRYRAAGGRLRWRGLALVGIGREFRPEPRSGSGLVRVLLPFGNAQGTETHQEFLNALKGAECMRSHGYPNWPDPNPNVAGVWLPTGVNTKSPQFQSAAKTCGVPMPPSG